MDPEFYPAIAAVLQNQPAELASLLEGNDLASRRSSCSHPTLLQFVVCEAQKLADPVAAAQVLLDAGAPVQEPLVAAASVDARQLVSLLIEHGGRVDVADGWGPLDEALYWRHLDLAAVLRAAGAGVHSLRVAAALGDLEALEGFWEDGELRPCAGPIRSPFADTVPDGSASDPDELADNALVAAAICGQLRTAAVLLDRGARVDGKPPGYHWRGTALHAAVWHGDKAMVQWLIAHNADPSITDDGVGADAAGWAQHHGHGQLVALLNG